jgi:hypothetical protein
MTTKLAVTTIECPSSCSTDVGIPILDRAEARMPFMFGDALCASICTRLPVVLDEEFIVRLVAGVVDRLRLGLR